MYLLSSSTTCLQSQFQIAQSLVETGWQFDWGAPPVSTPPLTSQSKKKLAWLREKEAEIAFSKHCARGPLTPSVCGWVWNKLQCHITNCTCICVWIMAEIGQRLIVLRTTLMIKMTGYAGMGLTHTPWSLSPRKAFETSTQPPFGNVQGPHKWW